VRERRKGKGKVRSVKEVEKRESKKSTQNTIKIQKLSPRR
jgi:hypothetical protein